MSQKVARTSLPACKNELLFGAASPAGGVGLVTTCSSSRSSAQSADTRCLCRACAALNTCLLASLYLCSTSNSHHAIYVLSPDTFLYIVIMLTGASGTWWAVCCAHPAFVEKKSGGESRLVADFSAQPVGWAELTPITLHNLLER